MGSVASCEPGPTSPPAHWHATETRGRKQQDPPRQSPVGHVPNGALKQIVMNSLLLRPSASPSSGFHQKRNKIERNTHNPCTHSGKLEALLRLYRSCPSCSGTRSARLPHERATAIVGVLHGRLVGVHHDGVLIYKLAGRIAERREWQCDALHFTLINSLFMLFLQVFPPRLKEKKYIYRYAYA